MATTSSRVEGFVRNDASTATTFACLYEHDETMTRYGLNGVQKVSNVPFCVVAMPLQSVFTAVKTLRTKTKGMSSWPDEWRESGAGADEE